MHMVEEVKEVKGVEPTPLDEEYAALSPEEREAVDEVTDAYEKIMKDVGVKRELGLKTVRVFIKASMIETLKDRKADRAAS